MVGNNMKEIKYTGLSSGKLKYPVVKTVVGTIIKANSPYYRVKTELGGRIVEIAKSAVFEIKNK